MTHISTRDFAHALVGALPQTFTTHGDKSRVPVISTHVDVIFNIKVEAKITITMANGQTFLLTVEHGQ